MLNNMMHKAKLVLAAVATLCLIGSGGAGVALAGNTAPSDSSPTQAAPPPPPPPPPHGKHHHHENRVQHGQFTLNNGRVVDVQHGQAVTVNPSAITVKSPDGFQATYTINSHTMVGKAGKKSAIDQVRPGDTVAVMATRAGTTATVDRIDDHGPAQPHPAPAPAPPR